MATLPLGRLHDVSNAADFVALTEANFEILTAGVLKHYQDVLRQYSATPGYSPFRSPSRTLVAVALLHVPITYRGEQPDRT